MTYMTNPLQGYFSAGMCLPVRYKDVWWAQLVVSSQRQICQQDLSANLLLQDRSYILGVSVAVAKWYNSANLLLSSRLARQVNMTPHRCKALEISALCIISFSHWVSAASHASVLTFIDLINTRYQNPHTTGRSRCVAIFHRITSKDPVQIFALMITRQPRVVCSRCPASLCIPFTR